MSPDHRHDGHVGIAVFACFMSVMAFVFSVGPCAFHDQLDSKVDHLEHRLDNIQDRR